MASPAPSGFDPNAFLSAQQTEANVKRPPLPVENPARPDGLYVAIIGEVKPQAGTIGPDKERAGEPWLMMNVPLQIEVPPQIRDALNLKQETITLTDRVMIDLTPQRTIDNSIGRNRGQRMYRDALDLNAPGQPFSWQMVSGRPILVKIKHEMYNEEIQERIGGVFKRT